ncbi:hypothetical protein CFI10_12200 [Marinobacterium iners]|uniref:DUF3135 domain-containing protein n=1 Tax=Marinobacterium iners TaxID=48076 RepID=UPI001A8E9D02|nr:DUF3135 domain-containing protein [Marinobacterium iners]QSR35748.1 hypothetical protein CFI10_12200 [Marinobacterium iners]
MKMMGVELPSFDELARLAADDPAALEALRQDLVAQHIASRPEAKHQKLERLQFRINGVLRRAGNPLHACVLLNQLMLDSTANLLNEMRLLPHTEIDGPSQIAMSSKKPHLILVSKNHG